MSTTFAGPENALKRAEELIHVGRKEAALDALHGLITSRRFWQKPLEKVMMRHVELCVDLRNGSLAKDGLVHYSRIACRHQQAANLSSLEEVIKHFIHLCTKKASDEATMNHHRQEEEDDALEDAPEDLMLGYVAEKDRFATPWFKFLWEAYWTVLEVLRNNSKLEALHAMAAHKAFQFCKQYKRSAEFRRLCGMMRNHRASLSKPGDRPDLIGNPESCRLYLDTRVEQLKVAAELSLCQEAFRSAEDIHGLMSTVKMTPKPSVLAVYYAKLAKIFWMSEGHHLYHAYAWLELFSLQKSYNRNLTSKDLRLMASSVLLAALSVAPYDDDCRKYGASHVELENEKERGLRLASLVDFFSLDSKRGSREKVSRASLLSELAARGVISCVSQEVQDLYNLMEHAFLPLDLASKVQPLLSKICMMGGKLSSAPSVPEIQLSRYQPALEKVTTLRVLQQASRVFRFMRIGVLSRMIPFFDLNVVEKIAVDAAKRNFVAMKVNHLSGAVHFGNMDIESDVLGSHLGVLADSLDKASSVIHPAAHEPSLKLGENLISLTGVVAKEHERLVARKSIIEKRKEDHEHQILEQEKAEAAKRLSIQKKSTDEERDRLLKEQRIRRQTEEKEQMEAEKARLDKIKQAAMDFVVSGQPSCPRLRWEMMEKKMEKRAKVMDYLERARRHEEVPLIEEAFRKRVEEEKVLHEQGQLREIKLNEQRHAGDLQEKNRLSRLLGHKNAFQESIVRRREAEFSSLRKDREERVYELVSSRKRERERLRKLMCYLDMEEQRIRKAREEEEERKRREADAAASNVPWRPRFRR